MESVFNMPECDLTMIFAENAYTAANFCASVVVNRLLMQLNKIRGEYLRHSHIWVFFPLFLVSSRMRIVDIH